METVLLTGGSGLIGSSLSRLLTKEGFAVINLSRSAKQQTAQPAVAGTVQNVYWDPSRQEIDLNSVKQADYIINLAGAGVADKRWTDARKQEILRSRVESGELLVNTLRNNENKVQLVINSSAIGWYGADPVIPNPHPFTEDLPADDEFLGKTCLAWEESIAGVKQLGKRLVILRTGIVLSPKGGALKEFMQPLRFGFATILGNGRQVTSWIHIDDMCRLFLYAIRQKHLSGVYNAIAANPVTNRQLILELARHRNKFYVPVKVPAFVLKLMLGEMSIEVLKSATVSAEKIQKDGFVFKYPDIRTALKDLV